MRGAAQREFGAVLARDPDNAETRWILEALRAEAAPAPGGGPLSEYLGTYTGEASIAINNAALGLRRGQRPPWPLVRIHDDVFAVRDEPFRRVEFERNSAGKITGFQLVRAGGPAAWFLKLPGQATRRTCAGTSERCASP